MKSSAEGAQVPCWARAEHSVSISCVFTSAGLCFDLELEIEPFSFALLGLPRAVGAEGRGWPRVPTAE